MSKSSSIFNQPKPFKMIFFVELWERFGFYGLQGILAVYFVEKLGFTQANAFVTFGAFAALVYGLVSLGGYVGDHILGTKRTMILGAVVLIFGYLMMAFSLNHPDSIFSALATIAVGNGLFKANPSSLLAKCYDKNDSRLDGAFTMYYMSINIGSFFALSFSPVIADKYGYAVAFIICAAGLMISLISYFIFRKTVENIGSKPDQFPLNKTHFLMVLIASFLAILFCTWLLNHIIMANIVLAIIGVSVFGYFIKETMAASGVVRNKMIVVLFLMIQGVVFYVLYAQMPTSLNFFAIHNVRTEFLGFTINPVSLQALNPFWIVLCSPVLAYLYTSYGNRGRDLSMPSKFTVGMFMCAFGFLAAAISGLWFADSQGMVSGGWMILIYFFQSIGELLISGLGLAMVASLVPQRLMGFTMGAWFLTQAISFIIGGYVATLTAVPTNIINPLQTLPLYTGVFLEIGLITSGVAIVMAFTAPLLTRMMTGNVEETEVQLVIQD